MIRYAAAIGVAITLAWYGTVSSRAAAGGALQTAAAAAGQPTARVSRAVVSTTSESAAVLAAEGSASWCERLTSLTIPDVKVVAAKVIAAGAFTPSGASGRQPLNVSAFCQVNAVASPTPDSHIRCCRPPTGGDGNEPRPVTSPER